MQPAIFNLQCQAIRQKSYIDNIDNLVVYYTMDVDSQEHSFDTESKMKLIRDSNETSFQFKLSNKLTFVDI